MQEFKMSNVEKLMIKRRRKRKKRIRKSIMFTFAIMLIFAIIICLINNNEALNFTKKLNVKTLDAPEYVEVQLINLGLARTGVKLREINNIVIHYVGNPDTTAQNNRDYFNKSDTNVCSHFVIGLDGEIIQCVPLDEKSNASNNRNLDTISIEVCHPDNTGKFNEVTYNSLVKLTAWLCDNSRLTEKDVIRHYDITGKECPKYFVTNESKWEKFLADVKTELRQY